MENKERWIYNKKEHKVVEQPTMGNPPAYKYRKEVYDAMYHTYLKQVHSLRSIPVSGKVDWKDGEDVTGKFTIEQDERQHRYTDGEWARSYSLVDVAIPIKQEQPQNNDAELLEFASELTTELVNNYKENQPAQPILTAKEYIKTYPAKAKDYILHEMMESYADKKIAEWIKNQAAQPILQEQTLQKAALEYAIHHSSAPDKETPDWIISDFKAGAEWQKNHHEPILQDDVIEEIKKAEHVIEDIIWYYKSALNVPKTVEMFAPLLREWAKERGKPTQIINAIQK